MKLMVPLLAGAGLLACAPSQSTNMTGNMTGASGGTAGSATPGTGGSAAGGSSGSNAGAPGGSTTGSGGRAGTGTGGAAGASAGTGGAGSGDQYVSSVTVTLSKLVSTILIVNWTQTKAADQTFVEFSFAGSGMMTSHPLAGATGAHHDAVLGVPASTMVTLRVVSRVAGVDYKTTDYNGTTGALPSGMPKPTVMMYDATLATPERWLVGAVENTPSTCTDDSCYFYSQWWLYILDRQGRVVWYYSDGSTDVLSFPRVARDGAYLFVEKRAFGCGATSAVVKTTLDRDTYVHTVTVPQLSDAVDMTNDGTLLYDTEECAQGGGAELRQMNRAGTVSTVWKCPSTGFANCYSNTINWDPATDTVLMSFPESNNVAQLDRKTGALVATYGAGSGAYSFSPSPWSFVWQHFANISPQGTLLVSTHFAQFTKDSAAGPHQHGFEEFQIDRTNKRLTRIWMYGDGAGDGAEWAASRGMALRLSNGNTLVNYGTGGVIREVTPDKKTVFYVKFDNSGSNDYFNKLVGHNFFTDDLYAMNGPGPQ